MAYFYLKSYTEPSRNKEGSNLLKITGKSIFMLIMTNVVAFIK